MSVCKERLTGKVIIVTGATKGMGRAIAERIAAEGGRVIVTSRNLAECEEVASEICRAHSADSAIAVRCDVNAKNDLHDLVRQSLDRFGSIDGLVACACAPPWWGPSRETPDEALDHQFLSVFKSKFWLSNLVIDHMVEHGGGSIVFISSGSAFEATSERSVYACMRAAEIQLMRNMAAEFGPSGVRVNAISPGLIRTFSSQAIFEDEARLRQHAAKVPMRRTGEPEEIAAAAVHLLSDDASFTTGSVVPVDGGRLLNAVNNGMAEVLAAEQNEEAAARH